MEVNRISQGRQISGDLLNKNQEGSKTGQNNGIGVKQNPQPAAGVGQADEKFSAEDVKNAVDKLNKFLEDNNTRAVYEVHDKFKDIMIKIVDNNTEEVLLEVPPKKILDMVATMCEIVGILIDKKA
jgi:flagellar protein FlaG